MAEHTDNDREDTQHLTDDGADGTAEMVGAAVAGMGNGNGVDRRRHVNDAFFLAVKLLYFVEIDDGCRYGLSAEAGRLA